MRQKRHIQLQLCLSASDFLSGALVFPTSIARTSVGTWPWQCFVNQIAGCLHILMATANLIITTISFDCYVLIVHNRFYYSIINSRRFSCVNYAMDCLDRFYAPSDLLQNPLHAVSACAYHWHLCLPCVQLLKDPWSIVPACIILGSCTLQKYIISQQETKEIKHILWLSPWWLHWAAVFHFFLV